MQMCLPAEKVSEKVFTRKLRIARSLQRRIFRWNHQLRFHLLDQRHWKGKRVLLTKDRRSVQLSPVWVEDMVNVIPSCDPESISYSSSLKQDLPWIRMQRKSMPN